MIHLKHPYSTSDDDALARMRELSEYWRDRHGLDVAWDGSSGRIRGKVKGVKFDGKVEVGGGQVRADVAAGFLAEKLGGRGYVERKIVDYMDPANSLEALRARRS